MALGASSPFIRGLAGLAVVVLAGFGVLAIVATVKMRRTRLELKRRTITHERLRTTDSAADQRSSADHDSIDSALNDLRSVPIAVLAANTALRRTAFDAVRARAVKDQQPPTEGSRGKSNSNAHSDPTDVLDVDLTIGVEEGQNAVDLDRARKAIDRARTVVGKVRTARELLDFDWDREIAFVVPPLPAADPGRDAIAVEDMRGLQSILKLVLMAFPRHAMFDLKLPDEVAVESRDNLLTICSVRRNSITRALLDDRAIQTRLHCHFERDDQETPLGEEEQWIIVFDDKQVRSPSYEQERVLKAKGSDPRNGPMDDVALIAKLSNPRNPAAKFVILAGVRAFGTWGAAEYLQKEAEFLLDQTDGRDFGMVVNVHLEDRNKVSAEATTMMRIVEP